MNAEPKSTTARWASGGRWPCGKTSLASVSTPRESTRRVMAKTGPQRPGMTRPPGAKTGAANSCWKPRPPSRRTDMKLTNWLTLFFVAALVATLGSGCKHRNPGVTPLGEHGGVTGNGQNPNLGPGSGLNTTPGAETSTTGIPANSANAHEGWIPHPDQFQADTVYFDFDSAVVKPSEQSKLSAVADYLKSNGSDAVRIEGHCDERGTEEYNRSLGERRALALREALAGAGVDPSRVDTVSFGKD